MALKDIKASSNKISLSNINTINFIIYSNKQVNQIKKLVKRRNTFLKIFTTIKKLYLLSLANYASIIL